MSGQMYGADVAELERLASEFRRTAEELNNEGSVLTGILNRVAWLGDIATHYVGDWTGVQIPKIGLSTQFLNDAADNLLRQAEEQRSASQARADGTSRSRSSRRGDRRHVRHEESFRVGSKSGALVRGVDESEIRYQELSDGTYAVVIDLKSGVTADFGDMKDLADIARGKWKDGVVGFDADATVSNREYRQFIFTDKAAADAFYSALRDRQQSFGSKLGFTMTDVKAVIRHLPKDLPGTVSWNGYRGTRAVEGSGSISLGQGAILEGGAGYERFGVETQSSDGSTGQLHIVRKSGVLNGSVKLGPAKVLEGGGEFNYERTVEIVRDAHGKPSSLQVVERYTGSSQAEAGPRAFGTGHSRGWTEGTTIESSVEFDLSDPRMRTALNAGSDGESLYKWASDNRSLGKSDVLEYHNEGQSSTTSLLFAGEISNSHAASRLVDGSGGW